MADAKNENQNLEPLGPIGAAVLFFLGAGAFAFLAARAPGGAYLLAETEYMIALRGSVQDGLPLEPYELRAFMQSITLLGGWSFLTGLGVVVVAFLLVKRRQFYAAIFCIIILGQSALSQFFKSVFGRERPDFVPHLVDAHSMSFPSGHATSAAAVYPALAIILASLMKSRRARIAVIVTAIFLAYMIGASRIFLGVHFPTDVFAGWALGTAWFGLVWSAALVMSRQ